STLSAKLHARLERICRLGGVCRLTALLDDKRAFGIGLPDADLAVTFVKFHADVRDLLGLFAECCEQTLADVGGQEFGSRVRDGQNAAIAAGDYPTPVGVRDGHLAVVVLDLNLRMIGGQQQVVIEPSRDFEKFGPDEEEVDYEVVFVERAAEFC